MTDPSLLLREKLAGLVQQWQINGPPSRYEMESAASELREWKTANNISGLWNRSPSMITATLDDGLGKGLEIIELFAQIAGIEVTSLGIMISPGIIIQECNEQRPLLLGLTVLRTSVLDDLAYIGRKIPSSTLLIVGGGPCLQSDHTIATQANLHLVAKDLTDFIHFTLEFQPSQLSQL